MGRSRWFADAWQDTRYFLRTLRKNPGFAAAAILTLALGIGANSAVFSVVNAVLLKPLPYPDPDRIVLLMNTWHGHFTPTSAGVSAPKIVAWRQSAVGFDAMAAYTFSHGLDATNPDDPHPIVVGRASLDFFRLFGVRMMAGRGFTGEEDRPGGPRVAVVSDALCDRELGGSDRAVGQTLSLDGDRVVIVGVFAGTFDAAALSPTHPAPPDVWVPLQLDPDSASDLNTYLAAARLRPGVSLDAASAHTALAAAALREAFPAIMSADRGLAVERLQAVIVNDTRASFLLIWSVVAFVLLIACANTINLLLARSSVREREIAVRMASGASRGRIVRQLLTESLLLALSGGAVGLAVGAAGVRALLSVGGWHLPGIAAIGSDVPLEPRVVVFTLAISVTTSVLCGLVPALGASRVDVDTALKAGGRAGSGGGLSRMRASLVVCQVALALMLLLGSALLIRSFVALREVRPGFDGHNVLTIQTAIVGQRLGTTEAFAALMNNGLRRMGALPGVDVAAATVGGVPLESASALNVGIVGRPREQVPYAVGWYLISPTYFDALKVPLVQGRLFDDRDTRAGPPVALVNRAMANRYWPAGDPMRDRILIAEAIGGELEETVPRQVVGIVGDVHDQGLDQEARPAVYVPLAQASDGQTGFVNRLGLPITWIVRTTGEPHRFADAIQRELRAAGGGLPADRIRSMDEVSAASTARNAFEAWLMTIFGVVALLLASVGLYGVMSDSVQQRRHEIGIRMALGASPAAVRQMVLAQGMTLAAAGVAIGLASSFGSSRLLAGFLFGVGQHDRVAFVTVPIVLFAIAAAAVWIPARAATSVDPMLLLRSE